MATKRIRRANILYNNPYQDLEQLGFGSWLDSQKEGFGDMGQTFKGIGTGFKNAWDWTKTKALPMMGDMAVGVADNQLSKIGAGNLIGEGAYSSKERAAAAQDVSNMMNKVGNIGLNMVLPGSGTALEGLQTMNTDMGTAELNAQKLQNQQDALVQSNATRATLQQQLGNTSQQGYMAVQRCGGKLKRMAKGGTINYTGQLHEGPDGGVPVDQFGNPNAPNPVALVEKGEVGWRTPDGSTYVFSDSLDHDKNKTFASVAKKIQNKYKMRLGGKMSEKVDKYAEKAYAREMQDLMDQQEAYRTMEGIEEEEEYGVPQGKSGIHIKPSKRGTFTAAAKKHGKGVQEFARQVLANKENYSSAMVKKANFARNASKWKHWRGGTVEGDDPLYGPTSMSGDNILNTYDLGIRLDEVPNRLNSVPMSQLRFPSNIGNTPADKIGMNKLMGRQQLYNNIASNLVNNSTQSQSVLDNIVLLNQIEAHPSEVAIESYRRNAQIPGSKIVEDTSIVPSGKYLEPSTSDTMVNNGPAVTNPENNFFKADEVVAGSGISRLENLRNQQTQDVINAIAGQSTPIQRSIPKPSGVTAEKLNIPTANNNSNENWQTYQGQDLTSAIGLIAPIMGNLIAARKDRKRKRNRIELEGASSPSISLERERAALREQANLARSNASRALKSGAMSQGQYLANIGAAEAGITRGTGQQLGESYQREEAMNAQLPKGPSEQAQLQAQMYNAMLDQQDYARQQSYMNNIINAINQWGSQMSKSKQNALALQMMNPDYQLMQEKFDWNKPLHRRKFKYAPKGTK